jgi:hypothetical protein
LDYACGSSVFEGGWVDRTQITYNVTSGAGKIVLHRFTKEKREAAHSFPLDIPSMCLNHRARNDLANMP